MQTRCKTGRWNLRPWKFNLIFTTRSLVHPSFSQVITTIKGLSWQSYLGSFRFGNFLLASCYTVKSVQRKKKLRKNGAKAASPAFGLFPSRNLRWFYYNTCRFLAPTRERRARARMTALLSRELGREDGWQFTRNQHAFWEILLQISLNLLPELCVVT